MSNLIEFPIADRSVTESDVDKLHSEAFRDLEGGICDCTRMAKIAADIVTSMRIDEDDGELVFAVCHVFKMLDAFKASYYARWHGEKRGAS